MAVLILGRITMCKTLIDKIYFGSFINRCRTQGQGKRKQLNRHTRCYDNVLIILEREMIVLEFVFCIKLTSIL